MERNELRIKHIKAVYTEIIRRLVNPRFKFSDGGAVIKAASKLLAGLQKEFGAVTDERIVDLCVCTAYAFRDVPQWTAKQLLGPASITRLKSKMHGSYYYEDRWLASASLSRPALAAMIRDRSQHPQAKFIYVAAEEPTKARLLNTEVGFLLCQTSTLGWSPLSDACKQCKLSEKCKHETMNKFPELYRIRIEYVQSNSE